MPSALVRKRAYGSLSRFSPYLAAYAGPRARMAYSAGRFVYKNRGKFRRAARTIGRAYRRSRSVKRRRITGAVKNNIQYQEWPAHSPTTEVSLNRKVLWAEDIKFTLPPDTNDDLRAAPAMSYKCNGFKVCYAIRNNAEKPVYVHMAIVQPKNFKESLTEFKQDFFSNPSSTVTKYSDFVEFGTTPTWDAGQDCMNLNKKKFNIFTHKRILLNGLSVNTTPSNLSEKGATWCKREHYYKLNKTFEFDQVSNTQTINPLWIAVWFETVFKDDSANPEIVFNFSTKSYVSRK